MYRQLEDEIKHTQEELDHRKNDSLNRVRAHMHEKEKQIERLTKELEYAEQKLNQELNEKQRQKDEMLRYHVERRKELEELHTKHLRNMKAEHDRKKLSDEEKFAALLEQKQAAIEQFEESILKLKMDQAELLDNMTRNNAAEL